MHFPRSDASDHLDVLVVGSVNIDTGLTLARLPRSGETVESLAVHRSGGGKGANQALAAAQLGARTGLLAAVGRDVDEALTDLVEADVELATLVRLDDELTGTAVLLITPDDNAIVIAPGANARLSPEHVRGLALGAPAPRVVALQHEVPAEVVAASAQAWAGHALIALNPSPWREVPAAVRDRVDLLVVNRLELGELLGVDEPADRAAATELLQSSGLPAAVVTLGDDGVLLLTEGSVEHLPAFRVDAVDTVGAGDAFLGALAAALAPAVGAALENGDAPAAALTASALTAAARRATAAAALAVTAHGARNPDLSTAAVDRLLDAGIPAAADPRS
jgi:ribokinase